MNSADDPEKKKTVARDPQFDAFLSFRSLKTMLLCAILLGCGADSKFEKVILRGSVTLDGQPIQNGEIRFYPIDGTPGSVSGGPIKDGRYVAKGRGGVAIGKCRVEIRGYRPPSGSLKGETPPGMEEGRPAAQYLPAKYNVQSELITTIESDNSDTAKDFNLSAD